MEWIRLRYKRFHPSHLLLGASIGVLIGLVLGRSAPEVSGFVFFAVIALFLGAMRSRRWWAFIILMIAGALLGYMRASTYATEMSRYDTVVGQKIHIQGVLSGDAQQTNQGATRFVVSKVIIDERSYVGEVYVSVVGSPDVKRGDHVKLIGKLKEGFASYGGSMSFAKVETIYRPNNIIRDVREAFSESVRRVVIEPMASLGLGFVVGQRSTLPDTLDEQLKVVGLTHIVVASGYNLTILVRFMMRLLARHSRYLAFIGSLILMLLFASFSGFSPSMIRAVAVTLLALLAWYVGRRFHPVNLLLYVAAGTALFNPVYIWSDLGWYLSFFAFAGVLIVAPLIIAAIYRRREASAPEQLVLETVSAELMALPLIAVAFGALPVFGLLANVLVAPLIPFAMLATTITGLLGFISPFLSAFAAIPTTIIIAYIIAVVESLSSVSWAQIQINVPIPLAVFWYALIALVCSKLWRKTKYDFRSPRRDQVA